MQKKIKVSLCFLYSPTGFSFCVSESVAVASLRLATLALAAGLHSKTSSLQLHSALSLYSGEEDLTFGKLTSLPDQNKKSCLLNNAKTLRHITLALEDIMLLFHCDLFIGS